MLRKAALWFALALGFVGLYELGADAQQAPVAVPPYRYGTQPVVLIPNVDNFILNEIGLHNYWNFGDSPCGGSSGCTPGPCATQLADLSGNDSQASPTPSPVPLDCSTPTASPYPYLGATGLVQDGTTMAELTNNAGTQGLQGQWFTPAVTGIMSNLCNNNAGGSCTNSFTVGCVVEGGNTTYPGYFFSADGTGTGLALGASASGGVIVNVRGVPIANFAMFASGHPYVLEYQFTAPNVSTLFLDGVQAMATTSPVPQVSPNSVTYFGSLTGSSGGWNGRMGKCWTYDNAAGAADARAIYNTTGFW